MTATLKRSFVILFFADLLVSLVVLFISFQWLQSKVMLLRKGLPSSGYNLLLAIWDFIQAFENARPAFL
jgi:hypothetical protein